MTAASLPNIPPPSIPPPPPIIPSLPPLPASVKLNPAITRVTVVPLAGSQTAIPLMSSEEIAQVDVWRKVDTKYEQVYRDMKTRMGNEFSDMVGQRSVPWWEKGTLAFNASRFIAGRQGFEMRYPHRRRDRDSSRRKGARREGIRLPRKIDPEDANRPEQLVPIRLEFDVEHHKMRDTFVWNLNDPVISPEDFAQTVVEDYKLAPTYHSVIVKTIQDQLSDFRAHSANYDGDSWDVTVTEDTLKPGALDGESAAWWSAWRKRLRTEYTAGRRKGYKRRKVEREDDDMDEADERPMSVEEFTFDRKALQDDMRVVIRLDITVGSIKLDDQFEWDLENVEASPEAFSVIYAKELGLGGEFKTAIAHSIREQVQAYQKSLFLVGQPTDGTPVQDEDLRNSILPSLSSGARSLDQVPSFTPQLNYLSDGELERNEKERDKDTNKRTRKKTRGGRRGVALPDREPIRTCRTPAMGFPELDAATLAAAAAVNAPTSRRAAAAAASLTIANMVASENGERAYTPLPAVPLPPPLVIKEKTIKGFFKAPSYDTSILRPRARIRAPISSTAADVSKLPAPLENDPPPPLTSTVMPPESRSSKGGLLPKRGRDDRDKDIVDGQRRNLINGVWHCSNCGCPESVAIGRRKGPLGEKSQCGTCGKYWHRHRRPRPVEYNSDLEYHTNLKREAEYAKTVAKRRGGAAALRAQSSIPATPSRQSPLRDLSPISDASSVEETPLAQQVKVNGTTNHSQPSPSPPPPEVAPAVIAPASIPAGPSTSPPAAAAAAPVQPPPPPAETASVAPPAAPPVVPPAPQSIPAPPPPSDGTQQTVWASSRDRVIPPQWLSNALQAMQAKWENDKFEITLRKVNPSSTPEWRIKCLDCPGKLYQPGPNETLSNYEVHLRNRLHRQRVNDRMGNSNSTTAAS
ncbi:SNF5-domain-containing protein [Roridomyces roridus]|uniref:SNF5-domain-containing protein n=1 Tax=Roridomyces roridus TaxID=1738132 RepID=A0AAD7BR01_9AGAR|nr:SNF5-domain-containing protein [Roridomyces roridus]